MNSSDQISTSPATTLDVSELIGESSRRGFLTKLAAGAAAATALTAGSTSVFAAGQKLKYAGATIPMGDAHILNYALTLEHIEARFYERAAQAFPGNLYASRLIRKLRFDEEAHVNALTAAIKSFGVTPAAAAMKYNFPAVFGDIKKFMGFAAVLEDTGVHAYHGQLGNIQTHALVVTAAQIATVEARHVGAIRSHLHMDPTDGPFDTGLTETQVLKIAGPLIGK